MRTADAPGFESGRQKCAGAWRRDELDHPIQAAGCFAGSGGGTQQFDVRDILRLEDIGQVLEVLVLGAKHSHGLFLVIRQPAGDGFSDLDQFLIGCQFGIEHTDDGAGIGRIGVGVAGRDRADEGQIQRIADFRNGVFGAGPFDDVVGQVDDTLRLSGRCPAGCGRSPSGLCG